MSDKDEERAKPSKQPMKPHGDKDGLTKKRQPTQDKAQDSIMVPEKQGGIAGP